ncbi:hypothetical protein VN97_g4533, partial [Penicillium thymicola]
NIVEVHAAPHPNQTRLSRECSPTSRYAFAHHSSLVESHGIHGGCLLTPSFIMHVTNHLDIRAGGYHESLVSKNKISQEFTPPTSHILDVYMYDFNVD